MNGQFELGDISPAKLFIAISASLGVVLALVIEPKNSYFLHFLQWQIQTTGAVIVIISSHLFLFKYSKKNWLNPWSKVLISGVLGALLFSPVAALSDFLLIGEQFNDGFMSGWFDEIMAIIPPMTIAWLAMNAPWLLGFRIARDVSDHSNMVAQLQNSEKLEKEPGFLDLTKFNSANEILFIKSELHYINLVSANSKQLILFSLKEAKSQLEDIGIQGVQCHRSFWVAESAIKNFVKVGREGKLVLLNGDEVPVSRTNVPKCATYNL